MSGTACGDPSKHNDNGTNPPSAGDSPMPEPFANGSRAGNENHSADDNGAPDEQPLGQWPPADQSRATVADLSPAPTAMAMAPKSPWALVGTAEGTLISIALDLAGKGGAQSTAPIAVHQQAITAVAISPDEKWAVTGAKDGQIKIWQVNAGANGFRALVEVTAHGTASGAISGIAVSPTAGVAWVATMGGDLLAVAVNATANEQPVTVPIGKPLGAVAISPNGQWLLVGESAGRVTLGTIAGTTFSPVWSGGENLNVVDALRFVGGGGEWAVSGDRSGAAKLWRVDADVPVLRAVANLGSQMRVRGLDVSRDGRWALIAGDSTTAELWRLDTEGHGQAWYVAELFGHAGPVVAAQFSADGKWAMTVSRDGTAKLWALAAN